MKTFKTITAIAVLATSSIFAQDKVDNSTDHNPSLGVKGGVNFASLAGSDANTDVRTSFHVGLVGELPLADQFSLQAEVLYSGQGYKSEYYTGSDGDKAEFQLDYINVPVLAKIYVTKGLSFEVGPQFGFLVSEEYDYNPNSNSGDIDFNNTALDAKNFEVAAAGGLTFQTEFGLFASGRYNYGISELFKDGTAFGKAHNSVFQISLGYKF